jgi:hypothetical protein
VDNCAESPEVRAKGLLQRILPEVQWQRFSETGILAVAGSRGTYRICADGQTTLVHSRTGRTLASACLQLTVPAPVHDRIIAEYLLIRNNEDLYWQTANVFSTAMDSRSSAVLFVAFLDLTILMILIARLWG